MCSTTVTDQPDVDQAATEAARLESSLIKAAPDGQPVLVAHEGTSTPEFTRSLEQVAAIFGTTLTTDRRTSRQLDAELLGGAREQALTVVVHMHLYDRMDGFGSIDIGEYYNRAAESEVS